MPATVMKTVARKVTRRQAPLMTTQWVTAPTFSPQAAPALRSNASPQGEYGKELKAA
jgi:hypothetical protein